MLNKDSADCVCKEQLVLNGNEDIYKNEAILNEWIELFEQLISSF